MRILLVLLALVSSLVEGDEVCSRVDDTFQLCRNGDTLTRYVDDSPTPREELTLELTRGTSTIIGCHALNNLSITRLWIESDFSEPAGSLTLLPGSFAGMKNLRRLSMRRIPVNVAEGNPLEPLGDLEHLFIDKTNLSEVPTAHLASVPNLQTLSLSSNPIRVIRARAFAPLKHLQMLDLTDSDITTIEPGAFETADLTGLPELRELHLPFNNIRTLPTGVFEKLTNLKNLGLQSNKITKLTPGVFGRLNLEGLLLSSNRISVIEPETFDGLTVELLSLNANHLETLKPRAFSGLTVEDLDLSFNKLREIGVDDFAGSSINTLKLTFNKITGIYRGALDPVKVRVELGGNKKIKNKVTKADLGMADSVELDFSV